VSACDITVACVLTPSGRGAVAVVAVAGGAAVPAVDRYFQAANERALGDQPVGKIIYGHWGDRNGEDLIVCRRSENALEIHCHGGRQSSAQILANLTDADCTVIDAEQWLARQQDCPLAVAAHSTMAQATTFRTAAILLAQYHGALRREIEAIASELDEGHTAKATARLDGLLQRSEFGRHLTEPWRVVIAGQPNVGKSSLINALVGYQRAIVFDQPGTTRDVVSATTAIEGWPVELSDTAGLHETTDNMEIDSIETAGMTLARKRLAGADFVVWVLDARELDSRGEEKGWALAQQQSQAVGVRLESKQTQIVINKIDLARGAAQRAVEKNPRSVGTCAVTDLGIEQLLAALAARLVPLAPPPDAAVPFATEQFEALQAARNATQREDYDMAREILRSLAFVA